MENGTEKKENKRRSGLLIALFIVFVAMTAVNVYLFSRLKEMRNSYETYMQKTLKAVQPVQKSTPESDEPTTSDKKEKRGKEMPNPIEKPPEPIPEGVKPW